MRIFHLIALTAIILAVSISVPACDDKAVPTGSEINTLFLQPENFGTLKQGLVYEGWVVKLDDDSNWVDFQSWGKFLWDQHNYFFLSPNDTNRIIDSVFSIDGDIFSYDQIAITLETHPGDDPAPSPTIVAVSPLIRGQVTFMEFPVNVSGAEGDFIIGTFSDGHYKELGQDISNEFSGIWFMDYVKGDPEDTIETYSNSLTLPVLPDTGYLYEGWIALPSGDTLSTGKFFMPDKQDFDNSHVLDLAIPNFPGEDFLKNAPDGIDFPLSLVEGGWAFITVEPNPDNDLNRPTNLVILRQALPINTTVVRSVAQRMSNESPHTFPRIRVGFLSGN